MNMSSKILPHSVVVIPRVPISPPAVLRFGFQTSTNLRASRLVLSSLAADSVLRRGVLVRAEEVPSIVAGDVDEVGDVVAVEENQEVETALEEPRKPRYKLGEIMGILNKKAVEASDEQRPIPEIRTGDVVQIKLEVPSNRRRLSMYKGIVMSRQNAGIHTTIRIRRIIAGVGVEIVFPIYSPSIKEIKVLSHRKVRRARLYYLRDKLPRFSTFK